MTPPPAPPPRPRLAFLDTLRGAAVAAVVIYHVVGPVTGWDLFQWDGPWRAFDIGVGPAGWLAYPLSLGWAGVALFFALSGYVIHLSHLHAPAPAGRFYARRLLRIYPPYLAALAVWYGFTTGGRWAGPDEAADLARHAALVHNYSAGSFLSINGSFWSLAVEAQFYLLYPLALAVRRRYGMAGAVGLAAGMSLGVRVGLLATGRYATPITVLAASVPVLWVDWLVGAWVAERHAAGRRVFPASPLVPAGLAAAFVASTLHQLTLIFSFTLASVAAAAVIDRMRFRPAAASAGGVAPLARLGIVSYSVYLWHQPLPDVLAALARRAGLDLPPAAAALLSLPLALAVGWASYRTVEAWGVRLARRWAAGRRDAGSVS